MKKHGEVLLLFLFLSINVFSQADRKYLISLRKTMVPIYYPYGGEIIDEGSLLDEHLKFGKISDFERRKFKDFAYFERACFKHLATFSGAQFDSRAIFNNAQFDSIADFTDSKFKSKALFHSSNFRNQAIFKYTEFDSSVHFYLATFADTAKFEFANFKYDVQFNETIFAKSAVFSFTHFNASVDFDNAVFKVSADFSSSKFNKVVNLSDARFNNSVDFSFARFNDDSKWFGAQFYGIGDFREAKFKDEIDFRDAEIFGKLLIGNSTEIQKYDFSKIRTIGAKSSIIIYQPVDLTIQLEKFRYLSLFNKLDYYTKKGIISTLKNISFSGEHYSRERFELDYIFAQSTKYQGVSTDYQPYKWYQINKKLPIFIYDCTMGLGYRPFKIIPYLLFLLLIFSIIAFFKMPNSMNAYINKDENKIKHRASNDAIGTLINCFYVCASAFLSIKLSKDIIAFFKGNEKRFIFLIWFLGLCAIFYVIKGAQSGSIINAILNLFEYSIN